MDPRYFLVKGERLVLRKNGTWESNGAEITHAPTRDTFARSIQWDPAEGRFYIHLGYERIHVEVEDTAWFVTALEKLPAGWIAKLSTGATEDVAPTALEYREENLYLLLKNGQRARFLSAPYYEILEDLAEDGAGYYITVGGTRVNLAPSGTSLGAFKLKRSRAMASRPKYPKRRG